MSKVLFACSKGTESAEFSVPYDILKRAGADLTIAKVPENDKDTEKFFETAHGLKIISDKTIEEVKNNTYDMIVCPGGLHALAVDPTVGLVWLYTVCQCGANGKIIRRLCGACVGIAVVPVLV